MALLSTDRRVFGKDDALFGAIEKQQGSKLFGNILDAGTGTHSLRWIATLKSLGMSSFTAVTADEEMRRNVRAEADALGISDSGTLVVGNWFDNDSSIEFTEQFDTILADYLIGAMDGFSPYKQDLMISKLSSYLKPGGRLYVVGLEPIPDTANGPGDVVCRVRKARDACILLAGHRCYREYPVEWVQRQVANVPHLRLLNTTTFPILYSHTTVLRQVNVARSKIPLFPSPMLGIEMAKLLDDLERESLDATDRCGGRIRLGFDYVVSAEKSNV